MVSRGSAPPRLWLSPRRPKAANLGAFFLGSGFPDLQRRRCSDVFEAFSFTIAPFDRLTPAERDQVMAASDIAVWPKGATVLRGEEASGHLHIVLKGLVQELSGTEVLAAYGPGESFDVKALRTIVRLRKQDANERQEQETILETYMQALGML